ncbi:MAG: PfkB family carbohydrate kinase [Candidatus Binataceae bacterium]|jgi:rfaE bifunctional protein nucleotidyltransferase chain/domain
MSPKSSLHTIAPPENDSRTRQARDKVKTLEQLGEIAAIARAGGRVVVLAHGVFDLVHMGHVRHLEAAHREGDVLIVTVTADAFVNKGPGRPIFPEQMRAEMLGALEYVDWVGINHSSSAEAVLEAVKPDVYVKGSDYENSEDDITGRIVQEKDAVEKHGGRLVFTKDITFSSSSLINKYLNIYDPPLRDFLDRMRSDGGLRALIDLIEAVKDYRVVLVGDTIIDEYQYVRPLGKAPKENIIASHFENREVFSGGVIATANHVASFCREVEVITALGAMDSQEELIRGHLQPNVKLTRIMRPDAPTVRKSRFVEPSYMRKLFEVYFFNDKPFDAETEEMVASRVAEATQTADIVIANDFGHGLISPRIVSVLRDNAPFLAVNAQTNAGNQGFNLITKYGEADYICLDAPEARLAVADKYSEIIDMVESKLSQCIDCDHIIITNGPHGCIVFERDNGPAVRIPAFTNTVVDTVGAGDAFLAVTAPLVCAGGRMDQIGLIGNAAGAIKVGIVGHRRYIGKVPMLKFLTALMK